MRYFLLFTVSLFLSRCGVSDRQYNNLKQENRSLNEKIALLEKEIEDIKFGSKNKLEEAKEKINTQDYISAKNLLDNVVDNYPKTIEYNTAKNLLKTIGSKAENQLFNNAQKNKDTDLLNSYISQYPKGRFYTKAKNLIKQFQAPTFSLSENNQSSTKDLSRISHKSRKKYNSTSGVRIGAICCDGTQSSATGRGACSHHGGVCQWIYQ